MERRNRTSNEETIGMVTGGAAEKGDSQGKSSWGQGLGERDPVTTEELGSYGQEGPEGRRSI